MGWIADKMKADMELRGFASIQTTTRYTKVSEYRIGQITSPLDLLGTEKGKVLG